MQGRFVVFVCPSWQILALHLKSSYEPFLPHAVHPSIRLYITPTLERAIRTIIHMQLSSRMLTNFRSSNLCLPVWHISIYCLKYTKIKFCVFHISIKLGIWRYRKNISWVFSRIGCWRRFFDLRGNNRKLHNEELHDSSSAPWENWRGMWHAWGERKIFIWICLDEMIERPIGGTGHQWVHHIRRDLREVRREV